MDARAIAISELDSDVVRHESDYLAITTVVQELLSLGRSRFAAMRISSRGRSPANDRTIRIRLVVVRLASAAVRHIRRGTTRGTRTDCRLEEVSVPARKALSSECRRLRRSNLKAAPPILANRRRVVSCLLVSLVRCSRHNRLGAVGAPPSREPAARQSRLHRSPQRGAGTLPSTLRSSGHRCPIARLGTHSLAKERQTVWLLAPHPLNASSSTSS